MREWALRIGGLLRISSRAAEGTEIQLPSRVMLPALYVKLTKKLHGTLSFRKELD